MDCCGYGHALTPRPFMCPAALAPVGAMLAGDVGPSGSTAAARTAETASAALDVLRKSISVDVHTHGGKTGITSKAPPNDDLANAMRAGSLAVACLADVPDGRSSAGMRKAFWPLCACPSRANSTGTISNVSLGWMRCSPATACTGHSQSLLAKPPIFG